jgi:hypothetical protein
MSDLIGRVKGLLLSPKSELPQMVADPGELKSVLMPYVAVLAAIGPIVTFLSTGLIGVYHPGTKIFGMEIPGGYVRMPVMALFSGIIGYAVSIGAWWFYSFILGALAPTFGGRKDMSGAFKVAAASATPIWVAGLLGLLRSVPMLGWLSWLAIIGALVYSVLIAIWAVPVLMGTPEDKAPGHALASMGIVVGALVVTLLVVSVILGMLFAAALMH